MTSDKAPLSLRIAAFLFVIEGAYSLLWSAHVYRQATEPDPLLGTAGQATAIVNGVAALLTIAAGAGILYRRPVWRTIGAWLIGLGCGYYLAIFLLSYWPLGPSPWDAQLLISGIFLALWGWQFWAVTNRAARIYLQKGIQPPQS